VRSNDFLAIAGVVLVAVTAILELVLSVKWNRAYFTAGLPIFIRRVESLRRLDDVSLDDLAQSTATVAGTPLLFRRLGPDAIAFRESYGGGSLHYHAIMHGVIRARENQPTLDVIGYANWFVIAGVVVLALWLGRQIVYVAPWLGAALVIVYFIQSLRYARVAKVLRPPAPQQ
jgi:hypothetical protein